MSTTTVTDVTVEPYENEWTPAGKYVCVTAVFGNSGADLPTSHGIVVTPAVSKRLVRAMKAGAVFTDVKLATNVHGRTYVAARSLVMAKYANADLRKLGY